MCSSRWTGWLVDQSDVASPVLHRIDSIAFQTEHEEQL